MSNVFGSYAANERPVIRHLFLLGDECVVEDVAMGIDYGNPSESAFLTAMPDPHHLAINRNRIGFSSLFMRTLALRLTLLAGIVPFVGTPYERSPIVDRSSASG